MNIIIAMILMVKGGNDYLKVINKYYPAVMREYNNSEDSIDIKLHSSSIVCSPKNHNYKKHHFYMKGPY